LNVKKLEKDFNFFTDIQLDKLSGISWKVILGD